MLTESAWVVPFLLLVLLGLSVYAIVVRVKLWFFERSLRALRDLIRD